MHPPLRRGKKSLTNNSKFVGLLIFVAIEGLGTSYRCNNEDYEK